MTGEIFICYRREDSLGSTGRLHDRLSKHFPEAEIFIDVDTIHPGENFVKKIEMAVSSCDILIAVIGKSWLQAADKKGMRRLDNPKDFVRIELKTALQREITVIPVLVEGASMPAEEELPEAIRGLSYLHAIELSHNRYNTDIDRLFTSIQKIFDAAGQARIQQEKKIEQEEQLEVAERTRLAKLEDLRNFQFVEEKRKAQEEILRQKNDKEENLRQKKDEEEKKRQQEQILRQKKAEEEKRKAEESGRTNQHTEGQKKELATELPITGKSKRQWGDLILGSAVIGLVIPVLMLLGGASLKECIVPYLITFAILFALAYLGETKWKNQAD